MILKILVDDHEIENASVKDLKRRLLQELLILLTSSAGKSKHRPLGDVTTGLDPVPLPS